MESLGVFSAVTLDSCAIGGGTLLAGFIMVTGLFLICVSTYAGDGSIWKITGVKGLSYPTVSPDGKLLLNGEGTFMVCRDASTGVEKWRTETDEMAWFSARTGEFLDGDRYMFITKTGVEVISCSTARRTVLLKDLTAATSYVAKEGPLVGGTPTANPAVVHGIILLRLDDISYIFARESLSLLARVPYAKFFEGSYVEERLYLCSEDTLHIINSKTARALPPIALRDTIPYDRVKSRFMTQAGHTLVVCEDGFLGIDSLGKRTCLIPYDPTDIENYHYVASGGVPYLLISHDEKHEVFNVQTGVKVMTIAIEALPGIIDNVWSASPGFLMVSTHDRRQMALAGIDVASEKVQWRRDVGTGDVKYASGHVPKPSGLVKFLTAFGSAGASPNPADQFAQRFNSSTGQMEADFSRQSTYDREWAAQRRRNMVVKMLEEVARKNFIEPGTGFDPRVVSGEIDLLSIRDGKALFLLYGAIWAPREERADYPDGEGLLTIDLTTGTISKFVHHNFYGGEDYARGFDATYIADVRYASPTRRVVFADKAIAFVDGDQVEFMPFKERKVSMQNGTLDSMWVSDKDDDTDIRSRWLVKRNEQGKMTRTVYTQQDRFALLTPPATNLGYALKYVNRNLEVYRRPGQNPSDLSSVDLAFSLPEDTIDAMRIGSIDSEDFLYRARGVYATADNVVMCAEDGVVIIPVANPSCRPMIKWPGYAGKKSTGVYPCGNGFLMSTSGGMQHFAQSKTCTQSIGDMVPVEEEFGITFTPTYILAMDSETRNLYCFKR